MVTIKTSQGFKKKCLDFWRPETYLETASRFCFNMNKLTLLMDYFNSVRERTVFRGTEDLEV